MAGQDINNIVLLGRISGIYGIRGWIKVYSYTRPRDAIFNYTPWLIKLDGDWQSTEVLASRETDRRLVCHLAGCGNRDAARALVGADIAVKRSQLPEPETGEVYWADLQGLTVINRVGTVLGKVDYLMETGANDVLVLRNNDDRERLIPYIKGQTIIDVDLEHRTLRVDWDEDF